MDNDTFSGMNQALNSELEARGYNNIDTDSSIRVALAAREVLHCAVNYPEAIPMRWHKMVVDQLQRYDKTQDMPTENRRHLFAGMQLGSYVARSFLRSNELTGVAA